MHYIESSQNPRFKAARQLVQMPSGKLRQSGVAICEGIHLAQALVRAIPARIKEIWLPSSQESNREIIAILRELPNDVDCFEVPDFLYEKLSTLKSPQGPLIVFWPPELGTRPEQGDVLVLDSVQDPGNVGALLRTASAAGISQALCLDGTAWPWSDKALRAGMGAQANMGLYSSASIGQAIKALQGRKIFLTHLSAQSDNLYDLDLKGSIAWVFGNEGAGVSTNWLDFDCQQVKIPQADDVESLNVAASCAVVLFEQRRQRAAS